jgi:NAD(P)H-flavin reductase/hemoglobin-like flavoprotein
MPRLLKESWALVEADADELANYFYARMFLVAPGLRELFPVVMDASRRRFVDALVHAMQSIEDTDHFDEQMRGLGRAHRKFHVSPEDYAVLGESLLEALRHFAADRWSIEYDQAWRDAYDTMATRMLRGAAADSHNPPFWTAEVVRHRRVGPDLAVFTVAPLTPYPYLAGQYASLECPYQPRLWRSYSIANAPREDGTLDFHVRGHWSGLVSTALVRQLAPGDMVKLGPAQGELTLDPRSTRDVVCVAGGTGLAPIKSIVEQLAEHNRTRWVHLFVGTRSEAENYDMATLASYAAWLPWLSLVVHTGSGQGFGSIVDVVSRAGPWTAHECYVSGPPAMVRAALAAFAAMGVPPQHIRYDPPGDV